MKHERGIKPAPVRWRRKRTLSRRFEFRPIEREDIRYAWAAYKKGCMASMGERWKDGAMPAADFAREFEAEVSTVYNGAWTLLAESSKGFLPIGFVLAFYSHPDPRFAPFMIVGDMIWFPWATARNKVEAAVGFFNAIRSQIPMVDYARGEANKRFFEVICQHGVMRRAGTMMTVYPGEPVAIFETRSEG